MARPLVRGSLAAARRRRLWSYLTESDKRATWLAAGEFDLRLGGRIELEFHHDRLSAEKTTPERWKQTENARFSGRITRLEPNRVLAFTWEWGDKPTDTHTGILADVLAGVEPRPFWSTHARLEEKYAASL